MDTTSLITIDTVKAFALLHNLRLDKLARFTPYNKKEAIGNLYKIYSSRGTTYRDSILFLGLDTGYVSTNSILIEKSNIDPITHDEFYLVIEGLLNAK